MHNEHHEKKPMKCLIPQNIKDVLTFPVLVLVLLLLLYVSFFKKDSIWLETMKVWGAENFVKLQQLYNSDGNKKQATEWLDAALQQILWAQANPAADTTANAPADDTATTDESKTLDKSKIDEVLQWAYYQGNKNAKIVLVEYTDLLCPFCKRHYNDQTLEKIVAKYPNDVALVIKQMPLPQLHPTAPIWAKWVICAGKIWWESKYYEYLAEAFKVDTFTEENILGIAKQLGLNEGKFTECANNPEIQAEIAATTQLWSSLVGQGTPGNLVLNRETGKYMDVRWAYPFEKFDEEVAKLLK